ncbi:hypothetical protein ACMG4M_05210 [Alcanivorax sp. IL3]|uniref:hypothetical protein n=1 Tax=unclassified Alcanivorax TaxID=2638842 RepID=UPI0039C3BFBC
MKIDRDYQKQLLTILAKAYPKSVPGPDLQFTNEDPQVVLANAHYLSEHGLVKTRFSQELAGRMYLTDAKITAKGLDFLADDGGLTAILEVVTVRLEANTIRALMGQKIESSDLPTHEKNRLLEGLKDLPNEAMKQLTQQIVNEGVERAPGILQWLGTLIGP